MANHTQLVEATAAEVRAEVARRNLDKKDLSRALHLNRNAVTARLNGKVPFSINELSAVARVFGLPAWELTRRAELATTAHVVGSVAEDGTVIPADGVKPARVEAS